MMMATHVEIIAKINAEAIFIRIYARYKSYYCEKKHDCIHVSTWLPKKALIYDNISLALINDVVYLLSRSQSIHFSI